MRGGGIFQERCRAKLFKAILGCHTWSLLRLSKYVLASFLPKFGSIMFRFILCWIAHPVWHCNWYDKESTTIRMVQFAVNVRYSRTLKISGRKPTKSGNATDWLPRLKAMLVGITLGYITYWQNCMAKFGRFWNGDQVWVCSRSWPVAWALKPMELKPNRS